MFDIDFQSVFNAIEPTLPSIWQKIVICCINISGSSEIKFFVKNENGRYLECFELGVPDEEALQVVSELYMLLCSEANEWRSLTITIDSNADFKAEADYSDIATSFEEYIKNWKNRYLV